jgi:hypothetical protein
MQIDLLMNPRNDFWVITTYFNLTNGSRRRANYHCFRRQISVPLLTVEWSPDRDFQLTEGDADVLLQVGGGDLMWQKERLLTMAVAALPDHVKYVAWIDCDVLFENVNWADEAAEALSGNRVVQLFREIGFPDAQESARLIASPAPKLDNAALLNLPTRPSYLSQFLQFREDVVRIDLGRRTQSAILSNADILERPAHGFAWAAQASFLRDIGLYDRCIVGSGDMHFCYGVAGLAQGFIQSQREIGVAFYGDCPSYRHWASRVAASCAGRLGCVGGRILHLFHGEMRERQYIQRIDNLLPFALDLDEDICAADGNPWSWKRDRSALNAYFLKYMRDRNEDGQHPPAAGVAAGT